MIYPIEHIDDPNILSLKTFESLCLIDLSLHHTMARKWATLNGPKLKP